MVNFKVALNIASLRLKVPVRFVGQVYFNSLSTRAMAEGGKKLNRLSEEKSPYLLQHASNPVDWYPWGSEAIQRAKQENKPIFLSVGYSTCHWCHVMERESFEDEAVGSILNNHFISIKVDREERPDVDRVYMTFIQATQGGGGWPMSVFLTPDLKPFFGGTYFPPQESISSPSFSTILRAINKQWHENPELLKAKGSQIIDVLREFAVQSSKATLQDLPQPDCIDKGCDTLVKKFDKQYGGFGAAPKFPQPSILTFLMKGHVHLKGNPLSASALESALFTLQCMSKGGIHDHVSQGFHRYSTDRTWHVPHFEKMLNDQAQLAVTYTEAYQITKDPLYKEIVEDILLYMTRDLGDQDGGFYSGEDADSLPKVGDKQKREGAFCVWSAKEVQELLKDPLPGGASQTRGDFIVSHFGIKEDGNVMPQQDPHGELTGLNVLICHNSLEETAAKFHLTEEQARTILRDCKKVLYKEREKRPRPHRDDKIMTSWNGMAISAFAKAGSVLNNQSYTDRAVKTAMFIKTHLYNSAGLLFRNAYRDKEGLLSVGSVEGFADDYANYVCGLLDLFDTTQDVQWVELANQIQLKQLDLFWDQDNGGLYNNTASDPTILLRMKEEQDGAEPSPNSISALNLFKLGMITGSQDFTDKSKMIISAFKGMLNKFPAALCKLCEAYMDHIKPPPQVIICGAKGEKRTDELIDCVNSFYIPSRLLIVNDGSDTPLTKWLPVLKEMVQVDGKPAAYVCSNFTCQAPVTSTEELKSLLGTRH